MQFLREFHAILEKISINYFKENFTQSLKNIHALLKKILHNLQSFMSTQQVFTSGSQVGVSHKYITRVLQLSNNNVTNGYCDIEVANTD